MTNRYSVLKLDSELSLENAGEPINAIQAALRSEPATLTEEEAQSLLATGNSLLDFFRTHCQQIEQQSATLQPQDYERPDERARSILDNAERLRMIEIFVKQMALQCFEWIYEKVSPDSPMRTTAFDQIMNHYEEFIYSHRDGTESSAPINRLLNIIGATDYKKKPGNKLTPPEVKRASERALAYLDSLPPSYGLIEGYSDLFISDIIPGEYKEKAIHGMLKNAKALETNAQPHEAVFNYTLAMRCIAGNFVLHRTPRGFDPSSLNPRGRELMDKTATALLAFANSLSEQYKKDAIEAYEAIIRWDHSDLREAEARRKLSILDSKKTAEMKRGMSY